MSTSFDKDDYFKIDPEFHIVGDMEHINHFPGVQTWWKSIEGVKRPMSAFMPKAAWQGMEPWEIEKQIDPEMLVLILDKYGIDIACLLPESMMDTTGYTSRWCSNGEMAKVVDKYPDRFIYHPNLSPIKHKGVQNTIWEMEYWVKERGAKIFKFFPCEDTYINDPELWPFYEKAQELGIVLCIHTGFCWTPPGKSKYTLPIMLDDVARDFPGLKLVAFHMGYPYCDDLNMVAMGHPNVYLSLSLLVPWALDAPRKFGKILGEALRFAGPERIFWGTDCPGLSFVAKFAVMGMREYQFSKELQEEYGYPEITDEIRRMIFGGNLARLLGIDPTVRRVK
ncbi:amidohydrolase family protein [Desulfosporosinus sp. BICA1-9]|uniref:amidohydrolase family protein n=1 Tax=Desulfosporosinus sp. BICA1-9 TaxID=1531958 RepID=UPI00054C1C98|nr:amidohydrolase family protein [Desulfosporosinus sp. BICA1-9]KJS45937.1 MAG: amidohydrolase [Peptococcaceae bacterium BRH_c23]KJS90556.1 MAG: amidohydrolase [Desulfosporosinus sp. BICA1-9]HBW35650.1 amidohydrolase [Desulfosporosinus sp.]